MAFKFNPFTGNLDIVNAVVTVESKSADFTAEDKKTYLVDSSGGAVIVTLPAPKTGAKITVKDIGSAETNPVIVQTDNLLTEDIDESDTVGITSNYGSITVASDGSNWFII